MLDGKLVSLKPYTRKACHEFYLSYVNDERMTYDEYGPLSR